MPLTADQLQRLHNRLMRNPARREKLNRLRTTKADLHRAIEIKVSKLEALKDDIKGLEEMLKRANLKIPKRVDK